MQTAAKKLAAGPKNANRSEETCSRTKKEL